MISDTMKQKIQALPAILSIKDAADFFAVNYLTVYRIIHRKELSAYKDNEGVWCISRQDLTQYCSKRCNL